MPILEVQNLIYGYSKGTPFEVGALKGVNASFDEGEIIGVIGHTGSGKSTLLQHLNGLLKPDSGKVLLNGEDIWRSKESVKKCRFSVGLCFQYPEQQLFESTVYRDIAFGPKNMGLDDEEIKARVLESISFVGLTKDFLERSPFDLSGGEKRRAAIAGVLSMRPKVLILDEPTAGLDPAGRRSLLKLIVDYNKKTGSTVIFVSHSMDDVAVLAHRVLVMNDGEIALQGTVSEVFRESEKMIAMGLDVPEITRVFLALREAGFDVPTDVFTVDQAEKILLALAERGRAS